MVSASTIRELIPIEEYLATSYEPASSMWMGCSRGRTRVSGIMAFYRLR